MKAWQRILGTWFGAGGAPLAPGTAGTAAALPLVALCGLLPAPAVWNPWCLVAAGLLFGPGASASAALERESGRHDPGLAVVDEVVGTLLTFSMLPPSAFRSPWTYAAGFVLFRLLDVWKPGPIRRSQTLPGGWGIMADDALAGLLGGVLMALGWKAWTS